MAARRAARAAPSVRSRLLVVGMALVLAWAGLGYRLVQVQVVRAAEYAERGLAQRLTRKTVAPTRGKIFDRNGDPLAMTVEARSIYAIPDQVEDPLLTAQEVAIRTGGDTADLLAALESGRNFVYLARQVELDVAQEVEALDLAGVYSHSESKRVYPAGTVAAQVVGVADIDGNGIEGLEYAYDSVLRGTPGELVLEQDPAGRVIPLAPRSIEPAIPGEDLLTSLDLPLQYTAQSTCADTLERTGAEQCWIVVLDAETGEVLAMAGAPTYDPELRRASDGGSFSNFAVRDMYEPGSTQKLITVSAALDTGVADLDTIIPDVADTYEVTPGACRSNEDDIYGCFRDFSPHETRSMTVREVFTVSSNVGTIKIQERIPRDTLVEYMRRFGQGSPTGIDYPGEAPGAIGIDPGCSSCWASAAIGYSVAVTPLQMAAAYAAIANDGVWIQPHLVTGRIDVDGEVSTVTPETRRVVSERTAWVMRELLASVVAAGTGKAASVPGYRVGGKTGTADKYGPEGYTDQTIASFVGMAPIDDPKIVVAVVVDSPAPEFSTGGRAAAPAFSVVMEAALHRLGVTPDGITG